jgi:hypothetical protein
MLLKKAEIKLANGTEAFEAIFKWYPLDDLCIYQQQIYLLVGKTAYKMTESFTKKPTKHLGLKLTADVEGVQGGIEGEIEIWDHDSDGAHDFITKFPVFVKKKKVEAEWEYEYHEDTDEIPTEEELKKYGNKYNPPEYFFRVKVGELAADSGLLEFKDWIKIKLLKRNGEPYANEHYILTPPDGSTKEGDLDKSGQARSEDLPPGPCRIRFPSVKDVEVLA